MHVYNLAAQLDLFDDKQEQLPIYTHVDATRFGARLAGDCDPSVLSGEYSIRREDEKQVSVRQELCPFISETSTEARISKN